MLDIGVAPIIECPLMSVDICNMPLRSCSFSAYTVHVKNEGSAQADSAYFELDFDPVLQVQNATLPWDLPQSGQSYRDGKAGSGF